MSSDYGYGSSANKNHQELNVTSNGEIQDQKKEPDEKLESVSQGRSYTSTLEEETYPQVKVSAEKFKQVMDQNEERASSSSGNPQPFSAVAASPEEHPYHFHYIVPKSDTLTREVSTSPTGQTQLLEPCKVSSPATRCLDFTLSPSPVGYHLAPSFEKYLRDHFPLKADFEALYQHAATLQNPQAQKEFMNELMQWHMTKLCSIFSFNSLYNGNVAAFPGVYGYITTSWIADANISYLESEDAKTLVHSDDREKLIKMSLDAVEYALAPHFEGNAAEDEAIEKLVDRILADLKAGQPVSISTGWHKHEVNITIHEDILTYINKGLTETPEATQTVYIMKDGGLPKLRDYLDCFLYGMMRQEDTQQAQINRIEKEMTGALGLTEITKLTKVNQKSGNCSYANNKSGIQAAALAMEFKRQQEQYPEKSEKEQIHSAKVYAQKIFKNIEMRDRVKNFEEFLSLEPLIINKATDLPPEMYYSLLSSLTDKMATTISTEKANRLSIPEFAGSQKFEQYSGAPYRETSVSQIVKGVRETAAEAIANSQLPLSVCVLRVSEDEMLQTLSRRVEGSFAFILEGKSNEYYVFINQADGEVPVKKGPFLPEQDGSFTFIDEESNSVNLQTLSDLVHHLKQSEENVTLLCKPPVLLEDSRVVLYVLNNYRKNVQSSIDMFSRKAHNVGEADLSEKFRKEIFVKYLKEIDGNIDLLGQLWKGSSIDPNKINELCTQTEKKLIACQAEVERSIANFEVIRAEYLKSPSSSLKS